MREDATGQVRFLGMLLHFPAVQIVRITRLWRICALQMFYISGTETKGVFT